jgi:putative oxidoreductase
MFAMNGGGTRLLFPGLSGFYASIEPLAYTLLRLVLGVTFFVHGWGKVMTGFAGIAGFFGRVGLPAPGVLAASAMFLETVGAVCLAVGLFTRFFAAALAIEMLIALIAVHWANGFLVSVSQQKNGYEFVLLLGIALLAVAVRGGGPYSVDAKIGKEL